MPCGDVMEDEAQVSSQEKENLAGEVMESLGEPSDAATEAHADDAGEGKSADPLYVQKRLKQQKRQHERELRALHDKIDHLSRQQQPSQTSHDQPTGYMPPQNGDIAEHIQAAVNFALDHKDREEAKLKEAEKRAHVERQYHELQKHLDKVADKYEDFDDVVRSDDVPFTAHMRDAALLLPHTGPGSAGEVLYKLGKNRDELERISRLHPLDQAREINRLSHALVTTGETKGSSNARPIGHIKSNPVANSHAAITDKTSPSEIRARMKAGKFR